jgi:hypothetical protein
MSINNTIHIIGFGLKEPAVIVNPPIVTVAIYCSEDYITEYSV